VDFTGDVERLKDSADHLPLLRLGWTRAFKPYILFSFPFLLFYFTKHCLGDDGQNETMVRRIGRFLFRHRYTNRDLIVKVIEERVVLQGEYAKKGDELIKEKKHRGSVLHCVYRSTLQHHAT